MHVRSHWHGLIMSKTSLAWFSYLKYKSKTRLKAMLLVCPIRVKYRKHIKIVIYRLSYLIWFAGPECNKRFVILSFLLSTCTLLVTLHTHQLFNKYSYIWVYCDLHWNYAKSLQRTTAMLEHFKQYSSMQQNMIKSLLTTNTNIIRISKKHG